MKSVLNILGYSLEQFQRNIPSTDSILTTRKSCWQLKMSSWIQPTMQQSTIVHWMNGTFSFTASKDKWTKTSTVWDRVNDLNGLQTNEVARNSNVHGTCALHEGKIFFNLIQNINSSCSVEIGLFWSDIYSI